VLREKEKERERERKRERRRKSESGWRIARETDGGVGWFCLKSKVDEEEAGDEDELAERTGERERESPEREWNQYVEASVCPWPYMRVSVPREAKHVSFHAG